MRFSASSSLYSAGGNPELHASDTPWKPHQGVPKRAGVSDSSGRTEHYRAYRAVRVCRTVQGVLRRAGCTE